MGKITNGMPATELPDGLDWGKAGASNASGNCVEAAPLPDGQVGLRNSRYPDGPVLVYTRDEIAALIVGAMEGDFDHLV